MGRWSLLGMLGVVGCGLAQRTMGTGATSNAAAGTSTSGAGTTASSGGSSATGSSSGSATGGGSTSTGGSTSGGGIVTSLGPVVGHPDGDAIAFLGIPYAAPPVGALRWQPPQPGISWSTPFQAAAFGPICPQLDSQGAAEGREDCLTLNVWTPSASGGPYPVMVFIHGGGYLQGSTSDTVGDAGYLYEGSHLASTQNVVVVTLEYRLGALGFLALPELDAESDGGSSGNYGFLDQVAALRWVQQNIGAFDGDPGRTLVFGESAGAESTCLHLISPNSAGLFTSALMESGLCPNTSLASAETADGQVVSAVNCATAAQPLTCLRAVPAAQLLTAVKATVGGVGGFSYGPVNDGRAIPENPYALFETGAYNRVPILFGNNADEEANPAIDPFLPIASVAAESTAVDALWSAAAEPAILAQYPQASYASPQADFVALYTDSLFTCPMRQFGRLLLGTTGQKLFRYEFTHGFAVGPLASRGAYHGVELPWVFHSFGIYPANAAELSLSDSIETYWARFADAGDPNGAGAISWPGYQSATDPYLILDDTVSADGGLHAVACNFWSTE